MTVYVNGEPLEVIVDSKLVEVLKLTGYDNKKGIAVAVNNQVVVKQEWEATPLADNDKVLIISATQGG